MSERPHGHAIKRTSHRRREGHDDARSLDFRTGNFNRFGPFITILENELHQRRPCTTPINNVQRPSTVYRNTRQRHRRVRPRLSG